jgi:Zn finger protein HypA/HybF involved in hydrogenase expression
MNTLNVNKIRKQIKRDVNSLIRLEGKHKFECEFCDINFMARYPEPSHSIEPKCPKCHSNKDVVEED